MFFIFRECENANRRKTQLKRCHFSYNKAIIAIVAVISLLYGLFFYASHQLYRAGVNRMYASALDISISKVLRHLPCSNMVMNQSELDLSLAYHLAHRHASTYTGLMSNAGQALKIFREVEEKNDTHANDAAMEIFNMLVRMPWNDNLQHLASSYANRVGILVSDQATSDDDKSVLHENLAIYFVRTEATEKAASEASLADNYDRKNFEDTLADAFIFLRHIRIELGRCIASHDVVDEWITKTNLEQTKVVTQKFLQNQYYHSWDVALVNTTMLLSSENSCHRMAKNYENLVKIKS